MLKKIISLKLPGSILRIEILDNKIYILDNKFSLFVYSNETFALNDKYFLLDSQDDKHIYEDTIAISKNLDFYNSFTKSTSGSIFNIKQNSITQSLPIELHKRDVSYSKFSPDSKLLLIGGEDGRTCFYDLSSNKLCFSFEARSDFISTAAFSHNNKLVCVGAYDKAIKIHDINKHTVIDEVDVSDTPEDLLFLDDDSGVIGITRDRKIFSYSFGKQELIYAKILFSEWPTAILRIGFKHIIVGTKGDILYIFDIDNLSLVRRFRVDNFGVKTLKAHDDTLYIGYANGELKIIDMHFLYEEFEENIKANKYAKATSLMKDNIFLMVQKITTQYDHVWEQVLDMAKDILADNDIQRAEKMVKPFLWDKRKKDEFEALHVNIADIKHFEKLIEQNSHIVAFKFADKKTYLKTLKSYQIIETNFNKKFQISKNLFSKDTQVDVYNAKNMISPYLSIDSKKDLITNLILNYKIFARSSRLLKSRNFKVYFRLVKNNEFLKDENLYSKIVELGNQTYSKLLKMEQKGNYIEATKLAQYLEDFIPFSEKVLDIRDVIESKINLKKLIKVNDVKNIYNTVAKSSELELSPIFIQFHKIFEATKEEATLFANEGKSPKVKEVFQNHLDIDYLSNSIAIIFKLSYLTEIELAMQTAPEDVNIRATIQRYDLLFGIDTELDLVAKKCNFAHLLPDYSPYAIKFQSNDFFDNIVITTK